MFDTRQHLAQYRVCTDGGEIGTVLPARICQRPSIKRRGSSKGYSLRVSRNSNCGLIVMGGTVTSANRDAIVRLTAQRRVPAIYAFRYYTTSGGLLSYGVDGIDLFRRTATYVDLILKGAKPADLPVQHRQVRAGHQPQDRQGARPRRAADAARPRRRGDRISAPAQSWCDPAGESPAQVRSSVRLVASVAWPLATVVAKRTQRLHGVWD